MTEGEWRIYAPIHYLTLSEPMLVDCQLYTNQWNSIFFIEENIFVICKISRPSRSGLNLLEILVASCYSFIRQGRFTDSGPCFTKRTDVLPQYLVKSRSYVIMVYTFPIVLTFDRHLGSSAAETAVKFQSDTIIITPNLAAVRLHEIWR